MGVLLLAVFKIDKGMVYTFKLEVDGEVAGPKLFLVQLLGAIVITCWSASISYIYFKLSMKGNMIRHRSTDEIIGGDLHYFGPIKFEGSIQDYDISE
jgi:ammonia channel protein AmtB